MGLLLSNESRLNFLTGVSIHRLAILDLYPDLFALGGSIRVLFAGDSVVILAAFPERI